MWNTVYISLSPILTSGDRRHIMEQHLQSEETESASPEVVVANTNPDLQQEQSILPEQLEQTESMEVLLASLKRQSRRHAWFGGIATLLVLLLGFSVAMGIVIY